MTLGQYYICVTSANISDMEIVSVPNIDIGIGPKNHILVGFYHVCWLPSSLSNRVTALPWKLVAGDKMKRSVSLKKMKDFSEFELCWTNLR